MPRSPRVDPQVARERESLRREMERLRNELELYRSAKTDLRDTEQRLRALGEHAPIVLFAVDRDGTFTLSEGRG